MVVSVAVVAGEGRNGHSVSSLLAAQTMCLSEIETERTECSPTGVLLFEPALVPDTLEKQYILVFTYGEIMQKPFRQNITTGFHIKNLRLPRHCILMQCIPRWDMVEV